MKTGEDIDVSEEADLCTFCYPPSRRNIVYETEELYVLVALGQFIEGYILLIEKDHVDCFAEVWDDKRVNIKSKIAEVLEDVYGSYTFFEHGRTGSCIDRGSSKHCYHAHLHCLPLAEDLGSEVEKDYNSIEVSDLRNLRQLRKKHPHYLFVESYQTPPKFFPVDNYTETQYLKKKACSLLGLPEEKANYKEYPFRDKMRKTSDELLGRFK